MSYYCAGALRFLFLMYASWIPDCLAWVERPLSDFRDNCVHVVEHLYRLYHPNDSLLTRLLLHVLIPTIALTYYVFLCHQAILLTLAILTSPT
jgi:hypothetical protein